MSIDHGDKRVGVAVGHTEDRIATPAKTLSADPEPDLFQGIAALADEYDVQGLVVGWPLNMDDSEGPQGRRTRDFAIRLAEALDRDVRLWDERLSSFQADQALAGQMTRKKRRARQDAVAAAAILEDFLARDGPRTAPLAEDAKAPDIQEREKKDTDE
jgi:putative Holliday junction resolvase